MVLVLAGAGARAEDTARYGLLPTLGTDGAIIGLETIDRAAEAALREEHPEGEHLGPAQLREPWAAAGCMVNSQECVARFCEEQRLNTLTAIVIAPGAEGLAVKTLVIDGTSGEIVAVTEGLLHEDPVRIQEATEAQVSTVMSAIAEPSTEVEAPDEASVVASTEEVEPAPDRGPNTLLWAGLGVGAAGAALTVAGTALFLGFGLDAAYNDAQVLRAVVDGNALTSVTLGLFVWGLPAVGSMVLVGGGAAATMGLVAAGEE